MSTCAQEHREAEESCLAYPRDGCLVIKNFESHIQQRFVCHSGLPTIPKRGTGITANMLRFEPHVFSLIPGDGMFVFPKGAIRFEGDVVLHYKAADLFFEYTKRSAV